MKLNEYREIYHPSFGKFVFKHRGSGLIVDNIFKPIKMIGDKVLKPVAEKALKSGIESAGDKIGKKVVTKAGHLLIKELQKKSNPQKQKQEDYDVLLNRMVSGEGYKKPKNQKKQKIKKFKHIIKDEF